MNWFAAGRLAYKCAFLSLICVQGSIAAGMEQFDPLSQLDGVSADTGSRMIRASHLQTGCADVGQKSFTLLSVVENALCHNPKTSASWANVKAQAAQVGIAKSAYLPGLSGSSQIGNDHTSSHGSEADPFHVVSDDTYHTNTINLNWVIYDFGARSSTVENAEKLLISTMASQDATLQTVFATTVKDYYAALVAQKNIQAMVGIETNAKNVLDAAAMRVNGGVAAISDQLQAKTAYSQAVYNRNKAEGDWMTALGAVAIDMGIRPDSAIVLIESDSNEAEAGELVQSVGQLLQSAQKNHPSLIAARAEMDAAIANVRMTEAQGRPSIGLVGRYNTNNQAQSSGVGQPYLDSNGSDRYIGIEIDIPIFEGFSRTYKVRNAQAQVELKESNLADTELQVAQRVWSSYQDLKVSAENLLISKEIAESAQEAFDVAETRYQKGVAEILEVLTTQTSLANAEQQRIQAIAGWQNARIQLAASVGNLSLSFLH